MFVLSFLVWLVCTVIQLSIMFFLVLCALCLLCTVALFFSLLFLVFLYLLDPFLLPFFLLVVLPSFPLSHSLSFSFSFLLTSLSPLLYLSLLYFVLILIPHTPCNPYLPLSDFSTFLSSSRSARLAR